MGMIAPHDNSNDGFILCFCRNVYVVVVPLRRARGVIRHLKSPDEMDLEDVRNQTTLRHELRNKKRINKKKSRLEWWVCDCLFSSWKTSVSGRGIPGSRSRWTWSGLTSRPVSHLPPCRLSSPWGTSWTTEAFRTKRWIRGRSTSSSSWLSWTPQQGYESQPVFN